MMRAPFTPDLLDKIQWPKEKKPQKIRGSTADLIAHAETPLAIVVTGPLTELSNTLTELENMDKAAKRPPGSFAKKIQGISMAGERRSVFLN